MIGLHQPAWLLLAVPLAAALFVWPMPSRLLNAMRSVVLLLLVLAMAGLAVRLPSRAAVVVVVADRSRSMPEGAGKLQAEAVGLLDESRGQLDELAVVTFGRSVAVEKATGEGRFESFKAAVGSDASNYAAALERAVGLIPAGHPGRVLVIGDGRWTGRDPSAASARAAARGIGIDYRLLERPATADLAIDRIDAPPAVEPGEGFMLAAWVRSPIAQDVGYELRRGNTVLARGRRRMDSGLNRLVFRDRAEDPGVGRYRLQVSADGDDPTPENNRARMLVETRGPRPILHLAPAAGSGAGSGLGQLLRAGKLNVRTVDPDDADLSLESLAGHSAVLIENVPASSIGLTAMERIAAWVEQTGAGVMMTGGQTGYGPGGYYRSPLEPVMPVSMELRREHRKLALAIVVALDRSGSMSAPVGGGKTKMDLANLGTAEVLDMLSEKDQFGVWAVDSSAHKIADLQHVTPGAKGGLRRKVLSIGSMGGGIFVYEALQHAVAMLGQSDLGTRHIILFSDAADSEQPGRYADLLDQATKAGITVSVIGLGTKADTDARLLEDIARRGDGRVFFTDKPQALPRLFAQDTIVVARSTFVDETTAVNSHAGLIEVAGRGFTLDRPIGGYNLTYLRDGATLGATTADDYEAPVVASWHVGAGRALAYTGEADGRFTGPIAGWPDAGEFFTSLARWTSGQDRSLGEGTLLTQRIAGDRAVVTLHLDPERETDPFESLPRVRVLRGLVGRTPQASELTMRWSGADELEVEVALSGEQTAIATVESGERAVSMPPVTLPYSPEHRPVTAGSGPATLRSLARATGGVSRDILDDIWTDVPRHARLIDLRVWLLLAAALVFLTEVLERRSGALSSLAGAGRRRVRATVRRQREAQAAVPEGKPAKRRRAATGPGEGDESAAEPGKAPPPPAARAPKPPEPKDEPAPELGDALEAARRRAAGRTKR